MSENKSYRIRTNVGDSPNVLNVTLNQTFDTFEILSLKLDQTNAYKLYKSNYGIIVGRVLANGGFGIPNAKVSVFIEVEDGVSVEEMIKYPYKNVTDTNNDLIRYNLLPDYVDNSCYQNVGTFPNKRLMLDNNDIIEIFDKYWKYTTTTNQSGDYMLFGIPTGNQTVHVDIDLSDIGMLSQRPRDMIYKGYNANQFESPNKFKQSTNLDSLSQIYSQNIGVNVFPFWGDTTDSSEDIAITRCDIQIQYQFEPTCIFMGSIVTDTGSNAIGKNCAGTDNVGKMSDLTAGEGSIEMIRKTLDGRVEEYSIKGNRLIDGDGVWCYQIPMNLDYVKTDEFGNIVPTDDPSKGIPTRTRVRFRISLDDAISDNTARKRCKYLVPNNPRMTDDYPVFNDTKYVNYEFGTSTREEDYRDMFWNKVYTVKNYIPRLQKNNSITNRKHTGIKMTNHYGDNNPIPYNGLTIKLSFTYRLICVITKIIIYIIKFVNIFISLIGALPCWLANLCIPLGFAKICPFGFAKKFIPKCIRLSSEFCDDGVNKNTYYPGCTGCVWDLTKDGHLDEQKGMSPEDITYPTNSDGQLMTCIENSLAQDNEATSFNFYNDWLNGVLYAPMWYRKITPKKSFFFGLFKKKAKDEWCSSNTLFGGFRIFQQCAVKRNSDYVVNKQCGNDCHKQIKNVSVEKGVIVPKETMLGQTVYYYKSVEYSDIEKEVILLFATDIVLLGSLNDCDLNGVPQFFKSLEPSTFNLPSDILFTDNEVKLVENSNGELTQELTSDVEMTGCDWGNINSAQECGKAKDGDSGLFYGIGCSTIEVKEKSCLNLIRICEFGVSLDEAKSIPDLNELESAINIDDAYKLLVPDGFVSHDELYNCNERSMFATMNGNNLKVKLNNTNGLLEYDFNYLYVDNFDGSMRALMEDRQRSCDKTYRYNYKLENQSKDYIRFRLGENPYFYDSDRRMPRYENSFYFYFGLKSGKTALEKFNSQFFSTCDNLPEQTFMTGVIYNANSWCLDNNEEKRDGYMTIDLTGITTPYSIEFVYMDTNTTFYKKEGLTEEKIYIGNIDNITEEIHKKRLEGFEPIEGQAGPNNLTLQNGSWKIIINDSNSNNAEIIVDFIDELLNFKLNTEDFKQPNNVLVEDFNSYKDICNDKTGFKQNVDETTDEEQFWTREIGGMIVVYGMFYRQKEITEEYIIKVESIDDLGDFGGKYEGITIKNGVVISGYGLLATNTYKNTKAFYIGVPKGGVSYRVTVTGLCNGEPSKNSVNRIVRIEEPIPFELFINDINYDLIKNFKTGWDNNVNNGNINDIYGWIDISNIGGVENLNYNSSNDEIEDVVTKLQINANNGSPYNWTEEYCYIKDILYDEYKNDTDTRNALIDILNTIIDKRIDLVSKMKTAFYMTCPTEEKSVQISVRTNDYPVRYYLKYIEEIEQEGNEDRHFIENSDFVDGIDVSSVSNVKIPTLTDVNNEYYGHNTPNYSNGTICFARDNTTNIYKKPYFVGVINSTNKTIPSKLGVNGFEDGNIVNMFGFHLIDKTLRVVFTSWSYIDDIPYYWPGGFGREDYRDGISIQMNGLFAGYLYNGISTEIKDVYAKFDLQTVGNKDIIVKTLTLKNGLPDEDAIPTKRLIIGYDEDFSNREYKKYILNESGDNSFYIPLPKRSSSLNIEDSSCSIDETIYANMTLKMANGSLNDSRNSKRTLKVSVSNGSSSILYYIVKWDRNNDNYPYNKISYQDGNFIFNANSYDDYKFLKYGLRHDDFLALTDKSVKSKTMNYENNNYDETKGYGSTGEFENVGNSAYFVIGITDNNCCVLSPIYEFSDITSVFKLSSYDAVNENGVIERKYSLDCYIEKAGDYYYIRNYDFLTELNLKVDNVEINSSQTIEKITETINKVTSLPSNPTNKDELYCIYEDSLYKVYSYTGMWMQDSKSDTEPSGINKLDIEGSGFTKFYLENDVYTTNVYKYSIITLTGNVVTLSYSNDIPTDAMKLEYDKSSLFYYKTTEMVDDGTGVMVEKTMYITCRFGWIINETLNYDPTIPHYQRTISYSLTQEQYNKLNYYLLLYFQFNAQIIIKNTYFYVTDFSGLKHSCKIKYIN